VQDGGGQLTTDGRGSLVFRSVSTDDEGLYSCTPYSPLGVGRASRPVSVTVRGTSASSESGCIRIPRDILVIPRPSVHFGIARSVHLSIRPSVCLVAQLPKL